MKSVRLINYRCFQDTGKIELKPITILVGANSSGKSSFIKLFPLIKQSIGIRRNGMFLWNSVDGVDFDSFINTLKVGERNMSLVFELENFVLDTQYGRAGRENKSIVSLRVRITLSKNDKGYDYLRNLSISFADQFINVDVNEHYSVTSLNINGYKINKENEAMKLFSTNSLLPRFAFIKEGHIEDEASPTCWNIISKLIGDEDKRSLRFSRVRLFRSDFLQYRNFVNSLFTKEIKKEAGPYDYATLYLWYNLNEIIDSINYRFLTLSTHISYIQPLRAMAQRYYRVQNLAYDDIASDGTNLAMFLHNLPKDFLEDFKSWVKNLFGFKIDLKKSGGHVQIMIEQKNEPERNLIDVGFGYSQILPILASIWRAVNDHNVIKLSNRSRGLTSSNEHIIVIEQPELHLHPRFISNFAEMLVKVIYFAKRDKEDLKIIVETHSETLINKIGELIGLNTHISKDDVNVLLFNARLEGMESYISISRFSVDGYLVNWPYGFFSGDYFEK